MKRILFVAILGSLICSACNPKSRIQAGTSPAAPPITLQDSLINFGKNYLRTPYRYGGATPRGFDCSGFTSYVYKNFGYHLPRASREQAKQYPAVRKADLQPGDLVFFSGRSAGKSVGHVGIVTRKREDDEFDFIHAARQTGVIVSSSTEPYYAKRYLSAGRVIAEKEARYMPQLPPPTVAISPQQPSSVAPEKRLEARYHTVKRGETLADIARMYDMPVSTVMYINNLKSKRIKRGQRLKVAEDAVLQPSPAIAEVPGMASAPQKNTAPPSGQGANDSAKRSETPQATAVAPVQKETATPPAAYGGTTHKVAAGESLFSIARRYNQTVEQLKALNGITSDAIRVGQVLRIGEALPPSVPEAQLPPTPQADVAAMHRVQKGETLYSIARKYRCSVDELKRWNPGLSNTIRVGDKLRVR